MQAYTDANGRQWEVVIDLPTAERVQRLTEVNILDADGMRGIVATSDDTLALGTILWAVCSEQAQRAGVTRDAFLRGIVGDAIPPAREALHEAITAFFPQSRRDQLVEKRRQIDVMAERTPGEPSTSSQEPSGSEASGA